MDHVKNFYKLDLSETMKTALKNSAASNPQTSSSSENMPSAGIGYVTEKLYMLLQLYLQNKGWNPSVELLQCFTELKDSIPNGAYLQVLASRLALDAQGRLILRDSGKIVLPFEHFANAVMLKHMSGPHGLHLSLEATIRAVVDSYTIGRENFGMEKDFIIEVVQSCPSGGCRYYKNHGMGMPPIPPFIEQSPYGGISPDFVQHMLPPPHPTMGQTSEIDLTKGNSSTSNSSSQKNSQKQQQHQQQITAAIIQQQNRAIAAQQSIEKFNSMSTMEKQRFLQQLDKKHYDNIASSSHIQQQMQGMIQSNQIQATQPAPAPPTPQPPQASPSLTHLPPPSTPTLSSSSSSSSQMDFQKNDIFKASLECIESNKDLLALHNGAWGNVDNRESGMVVGQDKIVRAFSELMRNMARMKTYIRPTMCKPYGKQSESLQKTLMDTVQLVQSLRNCLPAPHIQVNSWKSETEPRPRVETEVTVARGPQG